MHYSIRPNAKHESSVRTAFLEQIAAYDHFVQIIVTRADLIDPEKAPSLENLSVPKHHHRLIDQILYTDDGGETVLYDRLNIR